MKKMLSWLFILLPGLLWSQEMKSIKGKVISKNDGEVLVGASVFIDQSLISSGTESKGVIKNINLGTITDVSGNFALKVPKEFNTILCSFLGFETQVVDITGKSFVRIELEEFTSEIGEVVVTGYQEIEKRKLTSAVVKVNVDKIYQAGVANIDQMLSGQLAGIAGIAQDGSPGAPVKIRIRGTASLTGTKDPLWVLDGIPLEGNEVPDYNDKDNIDQLYNSSIGGLNPQDIADITILKDAAATAIYGARAANGVIVITTKEAKSGKMKINIASNTSFISRPDFDQLNLMNSNEKVDLELALVAREDLTFNSGNGSVAKILNQNGDLQVFKTKGFEAISSESQFAIRDLRMVKVDLADELYQNAVNQDHSLSISGGNGFSNYYFSLGVHTEKGTTIGTSMNR